MGTTMVAEAVFDVVSEMMMAMSAEHQEGEPPVEPVRDHGLCDDESPDKEEDDGVHECPEDDVARSVVGVRPDVWHVEDDAERQREHRRDRFGMASDSQ